MFITYHTVDKARHIHTYLLKHVLICEGNTVKDRIYSLEKDSSKTFTSYPDDHVTDFSEIFTYALNEFGIKWNQCNYVFFFNSLKYESYNIYTENDLLKSIRNRDENKTIFTKTEISKMSSADKSYAIILHFMQTYKMRHILILNEYIWE